MGSVVGVRGRERGIRKKYTFRRHRRIHRPRFPIRRENFGDSQTFEADICPVYVCMYFQDLLAQNGDFYGQNEGTGSAISTLTF